MPKPEYGVIDQREDTVLKCLARIEEKVDRALADLKNLKIRSSVIK